MTPHNGVCDPSRHRRMSSLVPPSADCPTDFISRCSAGASFLTSARPLVSFWRRFSTDRMRPERHSSRTVQWLATGRTRANDPGFGTTFGYLWWYGMWLFQAHEVQPRMLTMSQATTSPASVLVTPTTPAWSRSALLRVGKRSARERPHAWDSATRIGRR